MGELLQNLEVELYLGVELRQTKLLEALIPDRIHRELEQLVHDLLIAADAIESYTHDSLATELPSQQFLHGGDRPYHLTFKQRHTIELNDAT